MRTMSQVCSEAYLTATPEELASRSEGRRLLGLVNQASLFPHSGEMTLTENSLIFSGYRTLRPNELIAVEQEFIPEYNRFAAGGVRGGFPSFGFIKKQGAPLVLDLNSGERLIVLLGFEPIFGSTKNRDWLGALQTFAQRT